jgi:hypothetical protein
VTILDALGDQNLFANHFRGETWHPWKAALATIFGLPMDAASLEHYRQATERISPPAFRAREAYLICGRRAGKSRIAALVAVFLAMFPDYSEYLAPGERGTLMVIAADRRQARVVFRYIEGLIDGVPMLSAMVEARTRETIALRNRVSIEVHTASFRAVRGYTLIGCIADEVAFWRSDESANPDAEILNGLRPGMATVPGALLLCISTPYSRRGALWQAWKGHFGKDGDPVLVWRADTRSMNPTVDESVIQAALDDDEAAARAEYFAEFRRDIEGFVAKEAVETVVVTGRFELRPLSTIDYVAFVDPSGGSQDSMTLAIAHLESRGGDDELGVAVLDAVREVRPPFSPESVVAEFAALLKNYGVRQVTGDRFGGEFVHEAFRKYGIEYRLAEMPKSDIYRELLPLLNSGRVELLDNQRLIAQLCSLERRTARGGRESVDHPPNGRDDLINSAAGALVLAHRSRADLATMPPPIIIPKENMWPT